MALVVVALYYVNLEIFLLYLCDCHLMFLMDMCLHCINRIKICLIGLLIPGKGFGCCSSMISLMGMNQLDFEAVFLDNFGIFAIQFNIG